MNKLFFIFLTIALIITGINSGYCREAKVSQTDIIEESKVQIVHEKPITLKTRWENFQPPFMHVMFLLLLFAALIYGLFRIKLVGKKKYSYKIQAAIRQNDYDWEKSEYNPRNHPPVINGGLHGISEDQVIKRICQFYPYPNRDKYIVYRARLTRAKGIKRFPVKMEYFGRKTKTVLLSSGDYIWIEMSQKTGEEQFYMEHSGNKFLPIRKGVFDLPKGWNYIVVKEEIIESSSIVIPFEDVLKKVG